MPHKKSFPVCVIGSGLAGSECAYQLAKRGIDVMLVEMRPLRSSPAHHTAKSAELVCSNSLRSNDIMNAVGLLKEEMAALDSLIVRAAYKTRVPAGSALAVDREAFSDFVTAKLKTLPTLSWTHQEVVAITTEDSLHHIQLADGQHVLAKKVVVATGPLTSEALSRWILEKTGQESLYFYDAIAPIVASDSVDMSIAFKASRWGRGVDDEGDYLNCPMDEAQYLRFVESIKAAELIEVHDFDKAQFFDGCLPIEEMAARGVEVLSHGPMKPVGITNPHQPDVRPHAVVQLRQDNLHASLYNMVGFQTRMKWGEQKRILSLIPGLENAEFVRFGSMHRNTYLCSPRVLRAGMALKTDPHIHFAGQITGCEGYVESAAIGLYVALCVAKELRVGANDDLPLQAPPAVTALGALVRHILHADPDHYQPMNINFGLFLPLEREFKKMDKKAEIVKRASTSFRQWLYDMDL